jgi:ppGpp synthetase/RelA/SpoT-type nucleotidyltranferase
VADAPLADKLEALRAGLVAGARDQLTTLAQILTYTANYCLFEYEKAAKTPTDYHISLSEALRAKPSSPAYELLFKSTASIINKLWRKNMKAPPEVYLGNIHEHITDLVRTDITATTLDSARFLAERMNALPGIIYEPKVKKAFEDAIDSISFGPEMKMESGYFAYHGQVQFKTGLSVEVQIYSELMRQWRKLSHQLYERARVEGRLTHEFNSKESRLISLGHLLHVAECELQQLAQDFGDH